MYSQIILKVIPVIITTIIKVLCHTFSFTFLNPNDIYNLKFSLLYKQETQFFTFSFQKNGLGYLLFNFFFKFCFTPNLYIAVSVYCFYYKNYKYLSCHTEKHVLIIWYSKLMVQEQQQQQQIYSKVIFLNISNTLIHIQYSHLTNEIFKIILIS